MAEILSAPTVAQLASVLEPASGARPAGGGAAGGAASSAADPLAPVMPLATGGPAAPVFFLPPATGVSWMYARLAGHIAAEHPVYGLQSPGLRGGPVDFAAIVEVHLAQLQELACAGPYHLVGWSFGATVAHAISVRLRELGLPVGSLILLDGYPAGWAQDPLAERPPAAPGRDWAALSLLLSSIGYPAEAQAGDSLAAARAPGGPLAGLDDDTLDTLTRSFRANTAALAAGHSGCFDGNAVLVTSSDGGAAPGAWRPHITGRIEVHPVPSSHGLLTGPSAVRHVGPILARQLD
jgi:thioesterase domain-containing protein